ncbi:MAG: dihydrolipoyl dehydrogenase, partial [Actinomycetota bacterium]
MPDARVCVVGGGPAGDVAALRAAQLGAEVVLVERDLLGGTCVNRGCIPTKALLAGSELVGKLREAEEFGIRLGEVGVDWPRMRARADGVAGKMRAGVEGALARRGVTVIRGDAWMVAPDRVAVATDDGDVEVHAPTVVLAPGAEPSRLPGLDADHPAILDSTGALAMTSLPGSLLIVGGGIIGCEFASMLAPLGVRVTVVEALPRILASEDRRVSQTMVQALTRQGVEVLAGTQVAEVVAYLDDAVRVRLSDGSERQVDRVLVSVGRRPNTVDIGLEDIGVRVDARGFVEVDEHLRTGVGDVYAVGDAIATAALAHLGQAEGANAVETALDGPRVLDRALVPACIYTIPEIARVGMTADEARNAGHDVAVGTGRLGANGKALALGETTGFCQIVADRGTDRVLGATVMGPHATDLVHELGLALMYGVTARQVGLMIH